MDSSVSANDSERHIFLVWYTVSRYTLFVQRWTYLRTKAAFGRTLVNREEMLDTGMVSDVLIMRGRKEYPHQIAAF